MQQNIKKGVGLLIASAFFFALMSVFVRLSGDLPFFQKALFRNSVSLVVAFLALEKNDSMKIPRESFTPLACRSIFGSLGLFCNYYAIDRLLLANSNTLSKLSPFYAILFSKLILKEKMSRKQFLCVLMALAGSLFIIVPGLSQGFGFPSLVALIGGLGSGTVPVTLRVLKKRNQMSNAAIVFYFSAFSTTVALIPCLAGGWQTMTFRQGILLLCAGASCAAAQFCMTGAYRYAAPTQISVYDSSQIVFSALLGYLFFAQIPGITSLLAYIIIISASLILFVVQKKEANVPEKEKG